MLNKVNWLDIDTLIQNASLNLLHKIINTKEPAAIYNMFKNLENRRSIVAINLTYRPKNRELKNFFLYKGTKIYNTLPNDIKNLNPNKFKDQIKVYLKNNNISDTMDQANKVQ